MIFFFTEFPQTSIDMLDLDFLYCVILALYMTFIFILFFLNNFVVIPQ